MYANWINNYKVGGINQAIRNQNQYGCPEAKHFYNLVTQLKRYRNTTAVIILAREVN